MVVWVGDAPWQVAYSLINLPRAKPQSIRTAPHILRLHTPRLHGPGLYSIPSFYAVPPPGTGTILEVRVRHGSLIGHFSERSERGEL